MSLYEIAKQYEKTSEDLRQRTKELIIVSKKLTSTDDVMRIGQRINQLETMYYEMCDTLNTMKKYCSGKDA